MRAERVAMVTDFLADVTAADLAVERRNPWAPQYPETTLSCLQVILEEEWEHLRYALRDLDAADDPSSGSRTDRVLSEFLAALATLLTLPLLPPGEEYKLGFGIDDQVKVKYAVLEEKRGESGIISTSHVDSRSFRVNVKNLHERPINVTILDRVPVSQNDEIKVEYTGRATPTTQNVDDRRGVVAFEAKLDPDEEKILEYGYRISWPASKSIVYGP